jgi:hypothetical protein
MNDPVCRMFFDVPASRFNFGEFSVSSNEEIIGCGTDMGTVRLCEARGGGILKEISPSVSPPHPLSTTPSVAFNDVWKFKSGVDDGESGGDSDDDGDEEGEGRTVHYNGILYSEYPSKISVWGEVG